MTEALLPDAPEVNLNDIDAIVQRVGRQRQDLIPLLQAIQEHYRYLPREALRRLCELTEITPAQLTEVAGFYSQFRHRPVGEHVIQVCHGTACHVKGAQLVTDALHRMLAIPEGDDTDDEGRFTVMKVACLGCCTLAPAMQIDGITYGHLTPTNVEQSVDDFLDLKRRGLLQQRVESSGVAPEGIGEIRLCIDSCCVAAGTIDLFKAFDAEVRRTAAHAVVSRVGCVLMCHRTPMVEVAEPGAEPVVYANIAPEDVRDIVHRHFPPTGLARKLAVGADRLMEKLVTDRSWRPVERYALGVRDPARSAFMGPQKHIALEGAGRLDPTSLEDYRKLGGFDALATVLREMSPEEVIGQVTSAGLRGRGGAGFPTGRKWQLVRQAPGKVKYVLCNGDEGDPGAFMDRMLLESYPFRVIEGMIIAGFAVGAREGTLYIRHEYPLAVRQMTEALKVCGESGLLGESILGSGFDFELSIMQGAGAFVCGEETAMIASLEGRRGSPRLRPPYPDQLGLFGKPTLVNNVETYASVPWILREGPQSFKAVGTPSSPGAKVFALAGKVRYGGLIEVPMGMTIREVVETVGGGVPEGRTFKAVQIGGPSGGCVPAEHADTPIDYETLPEHGAIMGSGGLVVLDDTDCMVDIARYFLEFTQKESCGKCVPCRVGTRRMLDILERLCHGEARPGDVELLEELAGSIAQTSLCGLGQTAPNPILTTLRYFRDEYQAHAEGRCPARRCKSLIRYTVTDQCVGCTRCAQACPVDAIEPRPYRQHEVDHTLCTRCDTCLQICPVEAIRIDTGPQEDEATP